MSAEKSLFVKYQVQETICLSDSRVLKRLWTLPLKSWMAIKHSTDDWGSVHSLTSRLYAFTCIFNTRRQKKTGWQKFSVFYSEQALFALNSISVFIYLGHVCVKEIIFYKWSKESSSTYIFKWFDINLIFCSTNLVLYCRNSKKNAAKSQVPKRLELSSHLATYQFTNSIAIKMLTIWLPLN